jgi:hypothetical protein
MLARTGSRPDGGAERSPRAGRVECTQFALDALLDAQAAAARRPPFRVTPAHVLVGLLRQRRSAAGELLIASGLHEERVWAALDYRKWGGRPRGLRRLRDPVFATGPRWTHAARDVVAWAERVSQLRDTAVVDTVDLLAGIAEVGDSFADHLLSSARIAPLDESPATREAHLVELERAPTTQLPNFSALRKLHVPSGRSRSRQRSRSDVRSDAQARRTADGGQDR